MTRSKIKDVTMLHLKFQNLTSFGFNVVWDLEYVFPRALPNHTSYPASANKNAKNRLFILVVYLKFQILKLNSNYI